jgi:hypothetical protein
MRYWPLSVLRTSPLLPGDCAAELDAFRVKRELSARASNACEYVLQRIPAVVSPDLVLTTSVLAYMKYPTKKQWERLERMNIIQESDGTLFIFTAPLH